MALPCRLTDDHAHKGSVPVQVSGIPAVQHIAAGGSAHDAACNSFGLRRGGAPAVENAAILRRGGNGAQNTVRAGLDEFRILESQVADHGVLNAAKQTHLPTGFQIQALDGVAPTVEDAAERGGCGADGFPIVLGPKIDVAAQQNLLALQAHAFANQLGQTGQLFSGGDGEGDLVGVIPGGIISAGPLVDLDKVRIASGQIPPGTVVPSALGFHPVVQLLNKAFRAQLRRPNGAGIGFGTGTGAKGMTRGCVQIEAVFHFAVRCDTDQCAAICVAVHASCEPAVCQVQVLRLAEESAHGGFAIKGDVGPAVFCYTVLGQACNTAAGSVFVV